MLEKKENMEQMWLQEARTKYVDQWIIVVNCYWAKEGNNRMMGYIYDTTTNEKKAYDMALELKENGLYDKVAVNEGARSAGRIGSVYL